MLRLLVVAAVLCGVANCMPQAFVPQNQENLQVSTSDTPPTLATDEYFVGVGKRDVTGPVGSRFSGYDMPQKSTGLHMRLFARAFVFSKSHDGAGSAKPLVNVVVDRWIVSNFIKDQVLRKLAEKFSDLYTEHNVALSATHTHAGTSVWSQYGILQFSSKDTPFTLSEVFLIDGIVAAVEDAHKQAMVDHQVGYLVYRSSADANPSSAKIARNRSPLAFAANKDDPRFNSFPGSTTSANVDPRLTILKVLRKTAANQGQPIGALTWFGVQGTSLDLRQSLISGDNKGIAAHFLEKELNTTYPGFVGGFANSAFGDVSPNIVGPQCVGNEQKGEACDFSVDVQLDQAGDEIEFHLDSSSSLATCGGDYQNCAARGPLFLAGGSLANDTYVNARENGRRQFNQVLSHLEASKSDLNAHTGWHKIEGPLSGRTKYWNIAAQDGFSFCNPAVGWGYLSGTIDGSSVNTKSLNIKPAMPNTERPGLDTMLQQGAVDMLADMVTNVPASETVKCQGSKRILGAEETKGNTPTTFFGRVTMIQIFQYGTDSDQFVTVNVPLAASTYAGFHITETVKEALGGGDRFVQLTGAANAFHGYLTTPAEYNLQRFEGAATLYGPDTLTRVTTAAQGLVRCMGEGNCPEAKDKTDPSCPSAENCRPLTPDNAVSSLNSVAHLALTILGDSSYGNSTVVLGGPDVWGQYVNGSLDNSTTSKFTAKFRTIGSFDGDVVKMNTMELQCKDRTQTTDTWVGVYTDSDPETTVTYAVDGTNAVIAECGVLIPSDFEYDTYQTCRLVHHAYNPLNAHDGVADVDAQGNALQAGVAYSGHSDEFQVRRVALSI